MEGVKSVTMPISMPGVGHFSWLKRMFKQPVKFENVLKLLPLVTLVGFMAGPIFFLLFNLASGHLLPAVGMTSLLRLLFISGCFGALMSFSFFITCGIPSMYMAAPLKNFPKIIAKPLQVLTAFAGGALGFVLPSYLVYHFFGIEIISEDSLRMVLIIDGLLSVTLVLVIGGFAKLRAEVKRNEKLLYETRLHEKMLAERTANAQLRALQAQINPHFFFNSLSTIAALVSSDSATAKEMIISLSTMYRYTLRCTQTKLVSLEDSLEFVRSYLGIEEMRFRDRLKVEFEVPEDLHGIMLPGLILQPLVENAIKHGIAKNVGGGKIRIKIERQELWFSVTICNKTETKPDLRPENLYVEGHALKNVRDRLEGIYGSAHEFNFSYGGDHVCVSLRLPIGAQVTYD
jgi:sensor histidine kinase YesM